MGIYLAKTEEAQELFGDAEFGRKWTELYKKCPWATVFQDYQYLSIWNKNYRRVCESFFIYETDADENLIGLFSFAKCKQTGKLFIAGDYHAEYQTWLATPENGNSFAKKAFELLAQEFPNKRFQMMFLAPNTPLEWMEEKWAAQSVVKTIPRPLVNLEGENTSAKSLRKKGNKTRIRQLKKKGELEYKEIKSVDKFSETFDEIENCSRLRLSAIHGVDLENDPHRKSFHLDLMRETDILFPTALKVDSQTASAQVCLRNNDEMLLCMTSMSPFFAKQSPSKIHLLMLGNELNQTEYKNFDLSPGNGYKDRFANAKGETQTILMFFNKSEYLRHKTKRNFITFGREILEKFNVKKTKVFRLADKFVHKLRRVRLHTIPKTIVKNVVIKVYQNLECRMYSFDVSRIETIENPNLMNVNSIPDLLKYRANEGWQDSKSQFHQKVLNRFEKGINSYSFADDEMLLHYGWLLERQKVSNVHEVGQSFNLPKNTTVLYDYFTDIKARGKGLYQKSIMQGLHDAAKIPETEQVFIGVMSDNAPSRHVIEKLGFRYEGSLFKQTRFGFTRKWQKWGEDSKIAEKELILEESYSH